LHGILLAEKYLLVSTPFIVDNPIDLSVDPVGLSINSAMIAGPGRSFITEPSGKGDFPAHSVTLLKLPLVKPGTYRV
jgi:hypothetical protein